MPKRRYRINEQFKQYEVNREEGQKIYIFPEELKILEKKKLTPRLDRIRDLFLVQSYTGLRVIDLSRLGPPNPEKSD
jgi:hypothetical protein